MASGTLLELGDYAAAQRIHRLILLV
jgi:hypothetical protein